MAQRTIIVKDGQTIFDLALQLYGDVSKVYALIALNSAIENISNGNLTGLSIVYEDEKGDVSEFFRNKSLTLANRYPELVTGGAFLKQENGYYLLQENGYKIIL